MTRDEIMKECPEGFKDHLSEALDYLEGKFNDIKGLLEINELRDLGRIEDAYEVAKEIGRDLY